MHYGRSWYPAAEVAIQQEVRFGKTAQIFGTTDMGANPPERPMTNAVQTLVSFRTTGSFRVRTPKGGRTDPTGGILRISALQSPFVQSPSPEFERMASFRPIGSFRVRTPKGGELIRGEAFSENLPSNLHSFKAHLPSSRDCFPFARSAPSASERRKEETLIRGDSRQEDREDRQAARCGYP